jgi:uncharacterized protein (TIGR03437 family)
MAVDGPGNVYLTGTAELFTRFVTTADALQPGSGGCFLTPHTPPFGCNDALVMKFNAAGSLIYSSFLGGSGSDDGKGIAVDASGAVYVTGETFSSSFPSSPGALPRNAQRGFITKTSLTTPGAVVASVSAANYRGEELAPESIVAAFGSRLATMTEAATTDPLPTSLAGTSVKVRDRAGVERLAPLFFVSGNQVNYQMPPGVAPGEATVTITSGASVVSTGAIHIADVAPGLFTADASGRGLPAATAQRIRDNTTIAYEPIARFDAQQNRFTPIPIDLGPEGDLVILNLYGTGFRRRSALSAVTVKIGGEDVTINYAGPQLQFAGLDQINAFLPRTLAGRGEVDVVVTVDGKAVNIVQVSVK